MGDPNATRNGAAFTNNKLQNVTNAHTVDATQNWVKANGGSRDLNSAYSSSFYKMLAGNGANPLAQMQANAKAVTDQAFSPYAESMTAYASKQSEAARRAMEQRLAQGGILGTDSGAARSAIAEAVANPFAEASVQMQKNYGDMYQQNMQNMLGSLASLSQQELIAPQLVSAQTGGEKFLDFTGGLLSSGLSAFLGGLGKGVGG